MKKLQHLKFYRSIAFGIILYSGIATAQNYELDAASTPKIIDHPKAEYEIKSNLTDWQNQEKGLQAAFGNADKAYFKNNPPTSTAVFWGGAAWKGQRQNAMLLIWSATAQNQVRIHASDLKDENGNVLRKDNLQINLVNYVLSNHPYNATNVDCGEGIVDKSYLLPDRLESYNQELDRFDLPEMTVKPVWLAFEIPANAVAGTYKGEIEIQSLEKTIKLPISIQVQNQTLPKPHDWSFRLDLWQNPWVLAHYFQVKPWSEEHMMLLKKHLKMYADAGGKFITTYAVHSPWQDTTYYVDEAMIGWVKQKNGQWKFDYSIFDKYVQCAIDAGVDKAITIYTPIPWGERFRYEDETTGNYITERWLPTSDEFKANWNIFLTDLKSHLEAKGWFDKTYIGINENAMEQTLEAIHIVKKHSDKWKITYAGDWHPELDGLLDDYCSVFAKEGSLKDVTNRSSKGQTSTFYVCCTPVKPNNFVFSPPVEGRWIGLYTLAHGYDGFLRWAYESWGSDPTRDARHVSWGAGDAFLVYPGGNSSIRFEKLREGIVDFEKIKILQNLAKSSKNKSALKKMKELNTFLLTLNSEHDFQTTKIENDVTSAQKMINELSEILQK
ncbi:MAG TPA: glycoside hydrolase domain-containing protein [Flavobacterium sp.]|uniref:DUF4091 domain-containing protein n=1 Tax=Flavobacterium sp. TaxID=239 RepID=UPI002DB8BB2B|nr:glycoside hydrolase domain-containing protein [Flavobacterium sp.]HEU4789425.1 glycoside hydrolase domain-containing protein [Flavobacterium sp.]